MNWIAESRKQLDLAAALRAAMEELEPSDWRAIHDIEAEAEEAKREGERAYFNATGMFPLTSYTDEQEYEALRQDVRGAGHPI